MTTLFGKRALGALSWFRHRRHVHRPERLALAVAAIADERPDAILVGGDLCQIGTVPEIVAGKAWLERLQTIAPILLVPGNHDIYRRDSILPVLTHWQPWLARVGVTDDHDPHAAYPVEWHQPGLTLVGLNTAIPTRIGSARGRLGSAQLGRLEERLATIRQRGDRIGVLLHHPPSPGLTHWRKALADATQLTGILARYPVDFVLHGHLHRNASVRVAGLRVFGTASASGCAPAESASYRVFDIDPEASGAPITMHLKQCRDGDGFETVASEHWLAVPA